MEKIGEEDLVPVSYEPSELIVNLLSILCRIITNNLLSVESIGALVQGIRYIYDEINHRGRWMVDLIRKIATGNPPHDEDEI